MALFFSFTSFIFKIFAFLPLNARLVNILFTKTFKNELENNSFVLSLQSAQPEDGEHVQEGHLPPFPQQGERLGLLELHELVRSY